MPVTIKEINVLAVAQEHTFSALGLPNAGERFAKMKLSLCIGDIIKAQGLTQTQAAERMKMAQPDVSNIVRGKVSSFSIDRLLTSIMRRGHGVEIVIDQKSETPLMRVEVLRC